MTTATMFSLSLTEEERLDLLRIVDQAARDLHVEARRTENPSYQSKIHEEEARLRSLAQKLRPASI
jgi:hypothetical protein